MKGASVQFSALSKTYGNVEALKGVSLDIAAGEFVTLLGPSGSGKSTMLNVLAGFSDATSGDVLVDGQSILHMPPEKRNIGMVFQSYTLFPHMNVFENVAFPLRLRKHSSENIARRVRECLEMVQLPDCEERMPNQLSGGQRQRIAVARAVVFEPRVLLMDEPLGALDLKLRESMQFEIKRYHNMLGCTTIFVTHDQGEALALSDRIAVINEGKIEQVDTPSEIYDRPQTRFVAEFIGRTNILRIERGSEKIRFPEINFELANDGFDTTWSDEIVEVGVRPEKLRRTATERDDLVSFAGTVTEYLFQGDVVHYRIKATSGKDLQFQEHRGPGVSSLQVGDQLKITFSGDDIQPITDGNQECA